MERAVIPQHCHGCDLIRPHDIIFPTKVGQALSLSFQNRGLLRGPTIVWRQSQDPLLGALPSKDWMRTGARGRGGGVAVVGQGGAERQGPKSGLGFTLRFRLEA